MVQQRFYLDHNASTALLPGARDALMAALALRGNASSVHAEGRALRAMVDKARGQIAKIAGAERAQVVFTGSATEALTQAIVGGVKALGIGEIIVSAGEHSASRNAAAASGARVTPAGLDAAGRIDAAALEAAIAAADEAGRTALVVAHAVNNETGVVQDLARIETLVGPTPHYLLIDAVQAFGRMPLDFAARAADMMAVSGHKTGAPAGIGALLMKGHCDGVRLIPGGGQEQGRRGGTEAVGLIAAFGAAADGFGTAYDSQAIASLRETLEQSLRRIAPDVVIFGDEAVRLGNVTNFAVPAIRADVALMALDLAGVAVSSGSACSSGKVARSHVLMAMGVAPELADCALRVSLGWNSDATDVNAFLEAFEKFILKQRKGEGRAA